LLMIKSSRDSASGGTAAPALFAGAASSLICRQAPGWQW
jgi:hypothetical protein